MALPSYYISTSVTCVDTTTTSKILMLPPANTIPNVNLYIYDSGGAAATNPIFVSTQQGNTIDNGKSTITMAANNQSFRITPYSASKYAICQNYTEGLTPFQYALRILTTYMQLDYLTAAEYYSSAISNSGMILLATTTGLMANVDGIYVSTDGGSNFPRKQAVAGSTYQQDSSCMSSDGQIMWCSFNTGYIYNSRDFGQTWGEEYVSPGGWKGISCTSGSTNSDLAVAHSNESVFVNTNRIWSQVLGPDIYYSSYYSASICGNGSRIYVGTDVYLLIGTPHGGGGWDFAQGGGPSGNGTQWSNIVCNEDGGIVYAKVVDNSGGFVYKSTNSGATWTQLAHLEGYTPRSCDSTGNIIFFTFDAVGDSLFLSTDGGVSAIEVSPQLLGISSAMLSRNSSYFTVTRSALYGFPAYKGNISLA